MLPASPSQVTTRPLPGQVVDPTAVGRPHVGTHLLGGRDEDTALVVAGGDVTFAELRGLVAQRRAELGPTRRLVLLQAAARLDPVVTHLAALSGGHPLLVVEGGADDTAAGRHLSALVERFDPDVVAGGPGGGLRERRHGTRHALHPDLALLLSTSGSTGSPKLVRLSSDNVRSNAEAIASYLRLRPTDRAVTTMPLHYCYGLSVLHSHLLAGSGVVLSERSVVEDEFWEEFVAAGATSLAAVPYTFDLLDAAGFAEREVPGLRRVTQAGGRLAPDRVRAYARLGRRRGFELVVMYGQTEATARMAFVPPEQVEQAAGAIGVPVPGGRLRVDAEPGAQEGELVFEGPGVMLGYATSPADLSTGRTVHELRTGDRGRQRADGLFEVVGRMDRVVKVLGLRVDLDRVETLLGSDRVPVRAVGCGERVVLFVTAARHVAGVRARAADLLGLPPHALGVHVVAGFPRTSTGKPDDATLVRCAHDLARAAGPWVEEPAPGAVLALYRELLGRPDAGPEDSFASLGGDSLSYVEVSIRLEDLLGQLPRDWPSRSLRELADLVPGGSPVLDGRSTRTHPAGGGGMTQLPVAAGVGPGGQASQERAEHPAGRQRAGRQRAGQERAGQERAGQERGGRRWRRVETPTVLRAVAIVLVVGTHADVFWLQGGAHLLLAVVGYNLARFQLVDVAGRSRVVPLLRGLLHVLLPAMLWIGSVSLLTGYYRPTTALMLTTLVEAGGPWTVQWQFWFLEVVVWSTAGLAVLLAVPALDRLERRHPYGVALTVLLLAVALRLGLTGGLHAGPMERYALPVVLWAVALGWLVARSRTVRARLLASALTLVSVVGFFADPVREGVVVVGVLLLVWVPAVPVPRVAVPVVALLAGSSMFVYLSHWQVYPPFEDAAPWLGLLLSLVVGVLLWKGWTALGRAVLPILPSPALSRATWAGR